MLMIGLLILAFVGAATALMLIPLFTVGGLRPHELRDRIVSVAVSSYTHEGEPIPGAKPNFLARVIIRVLGDGTREDPPGGANG